jgi:hypothetical protein
MHMFVHRDAGKARASPLSPFFQKRRETPPPPPPRKQGKLLEGAGGCLALGGEEGLLGEVPRGLRLGGRREEQLAGVRTPPVHHQVVTPRLTVATQRREVARVRTT